MKCPCGCGQGVPLSLTRRGPAKQYRILAEKLDQLGAIQNALTSEGKDGARIASVRKDGDAILEQLRDHVHGEARPATHPDLLTLANQIRAWEASWQTELDLASAWQNSTFSDVVGEGDAALAAAAAGDVTWKAWFQRRLAEGVGEEDIRAYWNLTEAQRAEMIRRADTGRTDVYQFMLAKCGDHETAVQYCMRHFPYFGDPNDPISGLTGADRPLLNDFMPRIDEWAAAHEVTGPLAWARHVGPHTSVNALIRSEMSAGRL